MAHLPDELWRKILEMGVSSSNPNPLTFKDLCCLSVSCRRLHRLSNDNSLWSSLLSSDFLFNPATSDSCKSLYRIRYEKDKVKRIAAHRRAFLTVESRISEHSRRLRELVASRDQEVVKVNSVAAELSNLRKVRRASIALNVWQPEVIRGRQKQMVEQCAVPVESRINSLEMELKLCKQQIVVIEKAYRDEEKRLEATKEQLTSMKYHPLQDYSVIDCKVDDHVIKRRKLKQCSSAEDKQ